MSSGAIENHWFEVDFLPVGRESRSGDAIAMRWGSGQEFYVVVIDGGTQESGELLAEHVQRVYGAAFINIAISTHPDSDHVSGLTELLKRVPVRELWMHRPWCYSDTVLPLFRDARFTPKGLSDRLREALEGARLLEQTATQLRIPIVEPYQGRSFGPLTVLAPSQTDYLKLVPHFNNTPTPRFDSPLSALYASDLTSRPFAGLLQAPLPKNGLLSAARNAEQSALAVPPRNGLLASALADRSSTRSRKFEDWKTETLGSDGQTTEQNESSVVLLARFGGKDVLLTADAGQSALRSAVSYAQQLGVDLRQCRYYQVPHHGSRRNVSPALLDLLLGPRLAQPSPVLRQAVASVAEKASDMPRKSVVNAFMRRGVAIYATRGRPIRLSDGCGNRDNWNPIAPEAFSSAVEE